MKLDFFNNSCQEPPINHEIFGICDDVGENKAYTDLVNKSTWIATVDNKKNVQLTFTAIDNCLIQSFELKGIRKCDCMLTSNNHLYLIELKDTKDLNSKDGIEQLVSTIHLLKENHNDYKQKYIHKKVFLCNKQNSKFYVIDHEKQNRFYRKHGFRLDIQAKVVVV